MSGVKNVYVWDSVNDLTRHWHNDGGLVILAADMDRARELFEIAKSDEYSELNKFPSSAPKYSWEVSGDEEDVLLVFPDAGCC